MIYVKYLCTLLMVAFLAACGGGGGSAGTTAAGGGGSTQTATLTLELLNAAGATTVQVSAGSAATLRATLKDENGAVVPNRVVTFTGDAAKITFPSGATALTNASGIALVQVNPANVLATGAGTIQASAQVGSVAVSGQIDYQLTASNLSLANLNVGSSSLAAFGNRAVSVQVNINGVAAIGSPVQVAFSASCGTIEPASASTNSSGVASVTYKADGTQGCGGTNVVIAASTVGANPLTGNLAISLAPATNLQFVSASPTTIFLAGSGGATQSQLIFKVVNATGGALQGVDVRLSLVNTSTDVSLDTLGSQVAVVKTTDLAGQVTVPVFSGAVPSPVQVKAVLVANNSIETTSSILTVASGRAAQSRSSAALSVFSIEGFDIDGRTSVVTMSLGDRQGNPVPDGTVVNFVTEGGVMIPATCVTAGGNSQCNVSVRAQNPRPANGIVTVLAYVQGEEDFVDANFNNKYDVGESFTDLGNAYRDDNDSGTYDAGEFTVPRSGSSTCTGGLAGRANTCDGLWGAADVRAVAKVIFASSAVSITTTAASATAIDLSIADLNGNSPATGSSIAGAFVRGSTTCSVESVVPAVVTNTLTKITSRVNLKTCVSGDVIRVTVTSPTGVGSVLTVTVP